MALCTCCVGSVSEVGGCWLIFSSSFTGVGDPWVDPVAPVHEGMNVTLSCARGINSILAVYSSSWIDPSGTVLVEQLGASDLDYTIVGITRDQAGEYTCSVAVSLEGSLANQTNTVTVTVYCKLTSPSLLPFLLPLSLSLSLSLSPPPLHDIAPIYSLAIDPGSMVPVFAPVNTAVILTCTFDGLSVPANVSWAFNGSPISSDLFVFNETYTELTLDPLMAGDTGDYTCTATNMFGSSMAKTRLNVQGVCALCVSVVPRYHFNPAHSPS